MKLVPAFMFAAALAIAADAPAVGSKAPDFTLSSQEGSSVSLHDFQGKWVVVYFYPKDMTQGCTIEAHNFQRDLPQYDQKHAVILGISEDTVDSHKEFCTKESLTFKLLADSNHEVAPLYGSLREVNNMKIANRNTFLVDPRGVVRKIFMGVKPAVHSEEVLAALAELQKGSTE